MPQETDRLKLPLPLGNENVTRESINGIFEKIDAGVATQADLDTLREAVSKMDIPDASLTQKGKVQLSSKTDGTSEVVAATEKAVRDARVAAINAASTDATTKANAVVAPIISLDSSNLVQNSSANLGLYGWSDYGSAPWSVTAGTNFRTLKYFQVTGAVAANAYAVLDSNASNVIAGTYNLQAMFYTLGMTTGVLLIEVKNASDDVTINSLVADSNSNWHRKSKIVTIPSGVTSVKLRLVVAGGISGVPGSVKAISRIKFSAGAVDVPYTAEADDLALFQSGVDAKNGIVGAINAMGGNASTNDTWAALASKISLMRARINASDEYALVNNTSRWTTSSRSPVQIMNAKVYFGGTYRVRFTLATYETFVTGYAQIYVNGTARGVIRSTGRSSMTFVEDITANPDDEIQLRLWTTQPTGESTFAYVDNVSILTQTLVTVKFNNV